MKKSTRNTKATQPQTVDEYLAQLSPEFRAALEKLRRQIRAAAPEAVELISYGMPAFKYRGRILAYYAAFKDHLSFFPASVAVMRRFAAELEPYGTTGKGTIHFTAKKPLPTTLVKKIVRARVAENEAREANRKRSLA